MARTLRLLAALLLLTGLPARAWFPISVAPGVPARWAGSDLPVSFVIQQNGSDDIPDQSDDLAIRLGFQAWQDVAGASIAFVEDTKSSQRARTDFNTATGDPNNIHLILFDEDGSSGFFSGFGTIAITPVWANSLSGRIVDADVVFNGSATVFSFSTDLAPNTLDVQTIATHEIGHFLGLDHSGVGGSTMAPFADFQEFYPRTLALDDIAGVCALYPGATLGSISGTVTKNGSAVSGAHVWARSTADGRVASATLASAAGAYTLEGLAAGSYTVVAAPLDGAVTEGNMVGKGTPTIATNFEPGSVGPVSVVGTGAMIGFNIAVAGADPVVVQISSPGTGITIHPGETLSVSLGGTGLEGATVTVPDSAGTFSFTDATLPSITFTAGLSASPGLYDLRAQAPGGGVAYHTGFLEVLPAAPTLTGVNPSKGPATSNTPVTLSGGDFAGVPLVLFGNEQADDVSVLSASSLAATATTHDDRTVNVVVIDSVGGEEARLSSAYTYDPPWMTSKDRLTASIDEPSDTDRVLLEGIAGTLLTVKVKRLKGSIVEPALALMDSSRAVLLSTDPAHAAYDAAFAKSSLKKTMIRKFPLPSTQTYTIVVSALSGSGSYRLTLKERLPKSVRSVKLPKKPPLEVGPGTQTMDLVAKSGSLLSGSIKAKGGLTIEVVSLTGPEGSLLADPAVVAAITEIKDGKKIRFKKLPLSSFGSYQLTIGAKDLTTGPIKGKLKIRPPFPKNKFVE